MPLEPRTNRVVFVAVAVGADVRVDHERLVNRTYEVLGVRRVLGGRLARRRERRLWRRRWRRDSGWGRRERRRLSDGGSGRRSALGIHRPPATALAQPRRHAVVVLIHDPALPCVVVVVRATGQDAGDVRNRRALVAYPRVVRAPVACDVRLLKRLRAQELCANDAWVLLRAAASRRHGCCRYAACYRICSLCSLQPELLPCSAVKVPRLTGVSGLEIWIVTDVCHRSNVSEPTMRRRRWI